jgi:hypothetical protein
LTERLDEVTVWAQPYLVTSVDGVYLGDGHRRRTACNSGRHPLGAADRLQREKLILDRRDTVHRATSFSMRPTPGKGGGLPHSMRQPWCSRGAGAEFSRRWLKLATLHLVFLQFVVMAFRGRQGSQVVSVIATRCWLKQPASAYRPLAVC